MFNPTPFKALKVGLSASFFVVSAPLGSTITQEAFACSIPTASEVPMTRLVDIMPAYDTLFCSSCNPIWIAPKKIYCCYSKCCRASIVTSLTMSPITYKSSSIIVMGSSDVLVTFYFFMDPPFSSSLGRLMRADIS